MKLFGKIDIPNPWNNRSEKREVENAVKKIASQIKRQHSLYRKGIKEWKLAKISALDNDFPRRYLLQLIYKDVLEDGFIWGKWNNRRLRISNRKLKVNTKGKFNEEKTKLFQKNWVNKFLKDYIDHIALGYTLMFPKELDENGYFQKLDLVHHTNIVPETCEILKNVYDQTGEKFNEGNLEQWCMFFGDANDLGLLNKAVPLWIFKKHSWQNWDEFEEMFGVPMRIAKLASDDKRVQNEVQHWLKTLGSAAYGVFPEGTDLEIIESKSRDAFNVFNEKRKAANEELSILIDGQFESAAETGSRAKADTVIENTQKEITKDDATMALFALNEVLKPFMIRRGYPLTDDDEISWADDKEIDQKERLAIFKGVKELGYSVSKEQIEDELEVELTEDKTDPPKEPANFNEPHAHIGCGAHSETYRTINLTVNDDLSDDELKLLRLLWKNKGNINWSYKEFIANHGHLLNAVTGGFGEVDFDFDSIDHLTAESLRANIHRFGSDKTQKQVYELNQIIKDPDVDSFGKFFERARKVFPNYKRTWAQTEWEQAHSVSQASARYRRYMDNIDIAPFWRYKTVEDERVRPEHKALHNKVFRKDDPNSWMFIAPNGYRCRCDDEELIDYDGEISTFQDGIDADPDGFEKMQKSGHAVNWGDEKQVFTATQTYLHGLDIDSLETSGFSYSDFGLKAFSTMFKRGLISDKTANFSKHRDKNNVLRFDTVEDLPVWIDDETFDSFDGTINAELGAVLKYPDEVYFNELTNGKSKSYFKYYKNGSIEAEIFFNETTPAKVVKFVKHTNPDEFRNGLLIYTPKIHVQRRKVLLSSYLETDFELDHFNKKTGAFVTINKKHGLGELEDNKIIAQKLSDKGYAVALLEDVKNKKSPDAELNGIEWEFKTLTDYTNLKSRVKKELYKGSLQSSNVLLHINNEFNINDIATGIWNAISLDDKKRIRFVAVLFNDGRLVKFSRKQIESGEFNKLLKTKNEKI